MKYITRITIIFTFFALLHNSISAQNSNQYDCFKKEFPSEVDSKIILFLINGEDCINCYAYANTVIPKILASSSGNVFFTFFNLPKSQRDYFIDNILHFKVATSQIISFESVKSCFKEISLSTVVCLNTIDKEVVLLKNIKNLSNNDIHVLTQSNEVNKNICPADSFDITKYANSGYPRVVPYTKDNVLIYNELKGSIYNYDLSRKSLLWEINGNYFKNKIDSILLLNTVDIDRSEISYNKKDSVFLFSSLPRRVLVKSPDVFNDKIFFPIEIASSYIAFNSKTQRADTSSRWFSFLIECSPQGKLEYIWSFPYAVSNLKNSYNHFFDWEMQSENTLLMQPSTRRTEDSMFVTYTLEKGNPTPILSSVLRLGYPKALPRRGENGLPMKYVGQSALIKNNQFIYWSESNELFPENGGAPLTLVVPDSGKNYITLVFEDKANDGTYSAVLNSKTNATKLYKYDTHFSVRDAYTMIPSNILVTGYKFDKLFGLRKTEDISILYRYQLPKN